MNVRRASHAALVAAALGSVAACEEAPAAPEPTVTATSPLPTSFVSGERLRARYYAFPGGVRELVGWFDTAEGARCDFESDTGDPYLGPEGVRYCLPAGAAVHRADQGPFADAECKIPVARGVAPTPWFIIRPKDACDAAPSVRRALPSTRRFVYFLRNGSCDVTSVQGLVYEPGEEQSLARFVSARDVPPREGGPRIQARVSAASDGSRQVVGAWDTLRAAPARASRDSTGRRRWAPSRVAFHEPLRTLYGDASCRERVAQKAAHSAVCPIDAVQSLIGICGSGRFYEPGARTSRLFFAGISRGSCNALDGDPTASRMFVLGAPIADEAFVEARPRIITAGAMAIEALTAGDDEAPITQAALFDPRLGTRCVVSRASDGALHCFPGAIADLSSAFTDARCTEPAVVTTPDACVDAEGPASSFSAFDLSGRRAFEAGAPAESLFLRTAGGCVNVTIPHDISVRALIEVPIDQLPRAEEVTE